MTNLLERSKPKFVSKNVAQLFGNIPKIKENLWVIVIDEIERAQLDEIYRVVEIIERFKNEGRLGFSYKTMFILCISEPDFENLLKTYSEKDNLAWSIRTFFMTQKVLLCPFFFHLLSHNLNLTIF